MVFTGLSGSGKSSLAFDTIYAEGQRRYVESLSAYARQFLGQMDKPDVDFIEGLSPAISIDQKSASRNPRSTVGTITEVYDYLRLLYARIGKPHCPNCGRPVARQTPQQIVDRVLELAEGTRSRCWPRWCGAARASTPPARRPGPAGLRPGPGGRRAVLELADRPRSPWPATSSTPSRWWWTGWSGGTGMRQRLTESIETALGLTGGTAEVLVMGGRRAARTRPSPSASTWPAPTAASASRSRRPGASPSTPPTGPARPVPASGTRFEVDPELVVPDPDPVVGRRGPGALGRGPQRVLHRPARPASPSWAGFSVDTPWSKLRAKDKKLVLYGSGGKQVHVQYRNRFGRSRSYQSALRGDRPVAAAAATARPSRTGRGSRSSSTCARSTARPAAGPG